MAKRQEKYTPGPWYIKPKKLVKRDPWPDYYSRTTILDDPDKAYSPRHVIATLARAKGREDANARLIVKAPEMRENMIDNLTTIDLINSTALQICADCKWERQCKTCALSEVFRLLNGIQERTEKLKKEVDGEV